MASSLIKKVYKTCLFTIIVSHLLGLSLLSSSASEKGTLNPNRVVHISSYMPTGYISSHFSQHPWQIHINRNLLASNISHTSTKFYTTRFNFKYFTESSRHTLWGRKKKTYQIEAMSPYPFPVLQHLNFKSVKCEKS